MRRLTICVLALLVTGRFAAGGEDSPADAERPTRSDVNYVKDVAPLFNAHCLSCHSGDRAGSQLRLDSLAGARAGGATQRPILGGTLETNEIYRRVTSEDAAYRMPKGGEPLSPEKIDILRRWVEAGCPWMEIPKVDLSQKGQAEPFYEVWIDRLEMLASWLHYNPYAREFAYVALAGLVLTLVQERIRKRRRKSSPVSSPRPGWDVTRREYQAIFWIVFVAAFLWLQQRGKIRELQASLEQYQQPDPSAATPYTGESPKGPMIPRRMTHPKALARTYYRGNCERNPELFNSGNYCTNSFEVSLHAADGRAMNYGDAIPAEGLFVRVDIVRSPGSTPLLYQNDMMQRVHVMEDLIGRRVKDAASWWSFKTVDPTWRWRCDIPLSDVPRDAGEKTWHFSIGQGVVDKGVFVGDLSYGAEFELIVDGGHVSSGSDLWMGCFMVPSTVAPLDDRVPFNEWFDWRPLPVIVGENTKDLKALGVLDHRPELAQEPASAFHAPPPPALPEDP